MPALPVRLRASRPAQPRSRRQGPDRRARPGSARRRPAGRRDRPSTCGNSTVAARRIGQARMQRVGVRSGHGALGEHRKLHAERAFAQRGDFRAAAGLLREIVRRKAQHHQAAGAVSFVQPLQGAVLGREAAEAGGIDDQQDASGILAEVLRDLVLQARHAGVEQCRTSRMGVRAGRRGPWRTRRLRRADGLTRPGASRRAGHGRSRQRSEADQDRKGQACGGKSGHGGKFHGEGSVEDRVRG